MSNGSSAIRPDAPALQPLSAIQQRGMQAYRALLNGILDNTIQSGMQLRPEIIAGQLKISTTPVREALHRLERDGVVVKHPYQGWFVREFGEQEVRELYEMRSALECFAVRLACERITADEVRLLRKLQAIGESALKQGDMESYRAYNRDLHAAVLTAARNSYLASTMEQLALQSQMLMAKTIRLAGRPSRAIEEHRQVIGLIGKRKRAAAERVMESHILSALEDMLRLRMGEPPQGQAFEPARR
jgi:DNA-binding GntR family transcriptional regulator